MFKNFSRHSKLLLCVYFGLLLLFSIFSFGLTTPNLILINTTWFSSFQFWMWNVFYNNRDLASMTFFVFISLFFLIYFLLIKSFSKTNPISAKEQILLILLMSAPLLISSNMLSNDVFNYIFNSRMVIKYQANPHLKTALDYPFDNWTRFMHNIHTFAPYGYGWTTLSLIPYLFGVGKFLLTWLSFRLFSILSLALSSVAISTLYTSVHQKQINFKDWSLFFFNPLVLLEVINNFHNDLWMMAPAVISIALLVNKKENFTWSLLLFTFSVSIKYSSLALLPLILIIIISKLKICEQNQLVKKIVKLTPEIAAIFMFLPLLTTRSQQFHPWYLLWVLVWIPSIRNKYIKCSILFFSITSLFRYLPWLLNNGYSQEILIQQKIITWSATLISLIYFLLMSTTQKINAKNK